MINKENLKIINQINFKFGSQQNIVAIEELSELIKSLTKIIRLNNDKKSFPTIHEFLNEMDKLEYEMIEEIADVYIILKGLLYRYAISEQKIENEISKKLEIAKRKYL